KCRAVSYLAQRKTAGPLYLRIIVVYRRARIGLHKFRNNQKFERLACKRCGAEPFQIEHRNHWRRYTKERRLPSRRAMSMLESRHSFGLKATRKRVAMMRVPATNVPRNVPETFDSPPVRRRSF